MIEEIKETIIERIGELAPDASPATLKILATTLEIVSKVGKEAPEEKYLNALMDIFKKSHEMVMNNPLPEGFGLADISKMINKPTEG